MNHSLMRAVVTIFNDELALKPAIATRLRDICETTEIVDGCIYAPRDGMLAEFIAILQTNSIQYYHGIQLTRPPPPGRK